jgi:hypothetical protein
VGKGLCGSSVGVEPEGGPVGCDALQLAKKMAMMLIAMSLSVFIAVILTKKGILNVIIRLQKYKKITVQSFSPPSRLLLHIPVCL